MKNVLMSLVAASLAVFAVASTAQEPMQGSLTPTNAFSGQSEGNGTLKIFLGRERPYRVESLGVTETDGRFRLDQTVVFLGEPTRSRTWLITESSPDHYSGSLSDAAGPVTGETSGRRLMLRYRLKGPLVMHQTLELMADGKTIDNTGHITVLGIPVGWLHETIKRKTA